MPVARAPREIKLLFGAYNFDDNLEHGRFILSPARIIVHKDWNPFVETFDADLAMLVTEEQIPINNFIRPVCLWKETTDPIVHEGFIAGWGLSEFSISKKPERIPIRAKVPIISQEECFLSDFRLVKISSKRTFCGGFKNGSGPCHGRI